MSKHTPGPWLIAGDGRFIYALNDAGSNRFHAAIAPGHIPGYDPDEVQRANGRLIAAAPDMYSVLKRLLSGLVDEQGIPYDQDLEDRINDAKAAIAKVEGE